MHVPTAYGRFQMWVETGDEATALSAFLLTVTQQDNKYNN